MHFRPILATGSRSALADNLQLRNKTGRIRRSLEQSMVAP